MSRRALTLLVTALGLLLLAWQIDKIGVTAIADGVRRIGITGLLAILALSGLRLLLRSTAWVILMRREVTPDGKQDARVPASGIARVAESGAARVPLRRALAAMIAGDAVGNLTPLSLVVSEPTKAMLVGAHMKPQRALAALAAENFFYSLSVALSVLAGVAVLFFVYPVPDALRTASLVLVAAMAAVLIGGLWLIWKKPALLSSTLTRFSGFMRFTGFTRTKAAAYQNFIEKIRTLETSSYAFVRARPGRLIGVVLCESTFHVLSVAETWVTLYFLGYASVPLAIVLDTVQRMINVIFRVVPLKIGVDEAFSGLMSKALGFGSALGVTMGVIRKIRVLFWSLVGLVLLR